MTGSDPVAQPGERRAPGLRRRIVWLAGVAIGVLVVLRLFGVELVPDRWLVAAMVLDVLLGLAELAIILAAARAFRDGMREGGVLTGYERWIEKEHELGMPRPIVWLMRLELRLYRALARRR